VRSDDKVGLPQTYRYDSFNYSKNFDSGHWEKVVALLRTYCHQIKLMITSKRLLLGYLRFFNVWRC
jgi:hypothetical protein